MSDRLSKGPIQVLGSDVASLNYAFQQIQTEIDEIRGLRGRALMHDRLRVENPTETKDAVNLDTTDASDVTLGTSVFTKSFTSADQTITSGGALTITHSLGVAPQLIQVRLKNAIAEAGYSVGDEVIINPSGQDIGASRGIVIVPDATNLNVRFGSATSVWTIMRKDTGGAFTLTPASWVVIFRAYA